MRWSRTITAVGVHAEGEVGLVVVGGVLPPPGKTMFEKKVHLETKADWLRKFLLSEPRGGGIFSANLVVPPTVPEAAAGYIIIEVGEYPPMSGSNTLCTATALLETGIIPMREPETKFLLAAPGGLVGITATCRGGKCEKIRFANVPCFVWHLDHPLEIAGVGTIAVDAAYGGMVYAFADAHALGFKIAPDEGRDLAAMGERIRKAAAEQIPVVHPENPGIHTISIVTLAAPIRTGPDGRLLGRNAVVAPPGHIDRCPTGTATSARVAILHARGQIKEGQVFENRSIIDTRFEAGIERLTTCGGKPAVVPWVSGRAWITGIHQFGLDPDDPFPEGFRLDDGTRA